jgi:hypothetical protein
MTANVMRREDKAAVAAAARRHPHFGHVRSGPTADIRVFIRSPRWRGQAMKSAP